MFVATRQDDTLSAGDEKSSRQAAGSKIVPLCLPWHLVQREAEAGR